MLPILGIGAPNISLGLFGLLASRRWFLLGSATTPWGPPEIGPGILGPLVGSTGRTRLRFFGSFARAYAINHYIIKYLNTYSCMYILQWCVQTSLYIKCDNCFYVMSIVNGLIIIIISWVIFVLDMETNIVILMHINLCLSLVINICMFAIQVTICSI